MKKSAGLVIVYDNPDDPDYKKNGVRILLVHPTNAPWQGSYSIPKGHIEKGESALDAAIRETKEEVGIKIRRPFILRKGEPFKLSYISKSGSVTKMIHYYYVVIRDLSLLRMTDFRVPKSRLQMEEVNWGGFIPVQEARQRIFKKLKPILLQIERFKKQDWQI